MNKAQIVISKIVVIIIFNILVLNAFAQAEHHLFEKKQYSKKIYNSTQYDDNYNIIYHRIHWFVDPSQHYIKGSVFSIYTMTNNSENILFNLSSGLNVDSIIQRKKKIEFTHKNDVVSIKNIAAKSKTDSLTIYYSGNPPKTGFGSFETSVHNGNPILWTLSEPYGAHDWWPCKQSLTDKIDSIDIAVTVPVGNKAASNGMLVKTDTTPQGVTFYWKHRHPIAAYLVAIAVSNYSEFTIYAHVSNHDSVPILNYVYPESYERIYNNVLYTSQVMELFSRLFIPYPYKNEKYGHAQFGWSGGMEHQTMSFMGGFSKELIAHELAHQWFGNHITCGSWSDLWINEGFATWSECVVIEHLHPEFYQSILYSRIHDAVSETRSGSLYANDTANVDKLFSSELTYNKGAMVLHQLRHQIGDSAFFAAIKNMLNSKMHFVKTHQIQKFFEQAADTSLQNYFSDWVYGQGFPEYTIELLKNEVSNVVIEIKQTTSHESNLFFPMKVPLLLEGNNDTVLMYFHNLTKQQTFSINIPFTVNTIKFDPYYTIIAPHPARIIYPADRLLLENKIVVIPNPANDTMKIMWLDTFSAKRIEIYNMAGKVIYSAFVEPTPHYHQVDVSGYHSGEYIVKVYAGKSSLSTKFIRY